MGEEIVKDYVIKETCVGYILNYRRMNKDKTYSYVYLGIFDNKDEIYDFINNPKEC